MDVRVLLVALLCLTGSSQANRLSVSGSKLMYGGEEVYLIGANAAWNSYGYDFGNGHYDGSLEDWMKEISENGGNAFRIWVHVEGENTPEFDSNGMVTACDKTGDFLKDVVTFLDAAQKYNILVTFTLWNGATQFSNQNIKNLIMDENKLQSYLDNCLADFAKAVAGHPALGSWESINEPEGSVKVESNSNPCYDTTLIGNSGAGWANNQVPMESFLKFMGRINQEIKKHDPTGLVTIGSWGQFPQSDAFPNTHNYYTDECLNGAAGGSGAGIDYAQIHTYDWGGYWSDNAPFTVKASDYKLGKPVVIGEFASCCALQTPLPDLHTYGYDNEYSGTWTWHWAATGECSDTRDVQRAALDTLDGKTSHGTTDITVS